MSLDIEAGSTEGTDISYVYQPTSRWEKPVSTMPPNLHYCLTGPSAVTAPPADTDQLSGAERSHSPSHWSWLAALHTQASPVKNLSVTYRVAVPQAYQHIFKGTYELRTVLVDWTFSALSLLIRDTTNAG